MADKNNTQVSGGAGNVVNPKTAFNPKRPGRFPGDFKITRCVLISPTRGADSPVDLHDDDNQIGQR